jgi:hypothetical protein
MLYRNAVADPAIALPQLRRALADSDDLVRHIAAVRLALHYPMEIPEATTRELLNTLLQVSRTSGRLSLGAGYAEATEDSEDCGDLGQDIVLALARLPAGSADFAIPELVALWQRDRQFYEAVLAAVALAFPEGGSPAASALNQLQRALLQALVGDNAVWTYCGDPAPMLVARGLPGSQRAMRSFLATAGGSA